MAFWTTCIKQSTFFGGQKTIGEVSILGFLWVMPISDSSVQRALTKSKHLQCKGTSTHLCGVILEWRHSVYAGKRAVLYVLRMRRFGVCKDFGELGALFRVASPTSKYEIYEANSEERIATCRWEYMLGYSSSDISSMLIRLLAKTFGFTEYRFIPD